MRRRPPILIIATALAAMALALPVGSSAQAGAAAATPEDAVRAYVAAVGAGDVDAILATTAVDEMAERFDFQAYSERLRSIPVAYSLAPSQYPMFATMNRYQQAALILGQVRNLAYGLLSDETIDGSIIAPADAARIEAFVAAVDPSRLAGLTVDDVRVPEPDLATSERYLAHTATTAAIHGADELAERLALIELDGQTYGLGLTLLRYGDAWKVSSQSSALANTTSLGTAVPMTRAEFESITGG